MFSETKNLEKAFYSDGFKLGTEVIKTEQLSFSSSIKKMYVSIDSFIESFSVFAQIKGKNTDCKRGCDWCCYQPVFALDYELDYLLSFIRISFSEKEKQEMQKRAILKNKKLSHLSGDNLLHSKFRCPLLNKGACLAYEARPMACRIYISENVKTCLQFYHEPENNNNYPALLELPMKLGRMMNEGFKAGLKTKGIFTNEFRIEEKLQQI